MVIDNWLLYYVVGIALLIHLTSLRNIRLAPAVMIVMITVFFAMMGDIMRDISEKGWQGSIEWDLYMQMFCWFGALLAILVSANPRLSLKAAVVCTVLSCMPFFFYGAYTMRLALPPDFSSDRSAFFSASGQSVQLLDEDEPKSTGERGVMYLIQHAVGSAEEEREDKPDRSAEPTQFHHRIEFSPYSSDKTTDCWEIR